MGEKEKKKWNTRIKEMETRSRACTLSTEIVGGLDAYVRKFESKQHSSEVLRKQSGSEANITEVVRCVDLDSQCASCDSNEIQRYMRVWSTSAN